MNPESHEDWLDHVSGPRPDPAEIRRLQSHGVLAPPERRRLADELALNALLDQHRPGPAVSSNFARRVVAEVTREGATARPALPSWLAWLSLRPGRALTGGAALACACACVAALALLRGMSREGSLRPDGATMAHAAALPGVDAETLSDFDAVHRLGSEPAPDDDALILALAQ